MDTCEKGNTDGASSWLAARHEAEFTDLQIQSKGRAKNTDAGC